MKKSCEIAQLGNPVLRKQAAKVIDIESAYVSGVIKMMRDILSESNGVGLAAPQISESLRIVIIASKPSKRYPLAPEMEPLVMINPEFNTESEKMHKDWEGCLSIPGIRALVPRYTRINIRYLDEQGNTGEMRADNFIARIFQHEYDHLNGLVYLDRIESNRDIISETEFQKIFA